MKGRDDGPSYLAVDGLTNHLISPPPKSGSGGFKTREEYESFLKKEGSLPKGFRTGTSWISFIPVEANIPSRMNVTLIVLDVRTPSRRAGVEGRKGGFVLVQGPGVLSE